jgi:hypothetical protein
VSDYDIVDASLLVLARVDLLIDSPCKWLMDQVLQVSDLRDLAGVSGVVCVDHAHVVLFCQIFEVVQQVFDLLEVLLLLGRGLGKQA